MTGIADLSPTDASNTSITGQSLDGSIANMSAMDNTLQAILGMLGRWTSSDTLASATTTDIGAQEEAYLTISGTTTITGLGTARTGTMRFLMFSGALTLTHNATSLILPGAANITTAAGDVAIMVSEGSGNWRCLAYQRAATGWQPPVVTKWVIYTPTLVGFGTATGLTFYSRRVGSNLELFARFAAGTSTATEARIPLGFNGTEANVAVSSLMNSAVFKVGDGALSIAAASHYIITALGGSTYLRVGLQSASRAGLSAVDGNVALPSSGDVLSFTATVPIEGWQ